MRLIHLCEDGEDRRTGEASRRLKDRQHKDAVDHVRPHLLLDLLTDPVVQNIEVRNHQTVGEGCDTHTDVEHGIGLGDEDEARGQKKQSRKGQNTKLRELALAKVEDQERAGEAHKSRDVDPVQIVLVVDDMVEVRGQKEGVAHKHPVHQSVEETDQNDSPEAVEDQTTDRPTDHRVTETRLCRDKG